MDNKKSLFEIVDRKNDFIETNDTDDFMSRVNELVRLKNLKERKIEYDEKKKTIIVQGKNDDSIVNVTIKKTEHGNVQTTSNYKRVNKKSEYKKDVIELYQNGFKQTEIAQQLGISQSLVSKLLKR